MNDINCQHNAYLESIKMSMIGRKLEKHNRQISDSSLASSVRTDQMVLNFYKYMSISHEGCWGNQQLSNNMASQV